MSFNGSKPVGSWTPSEARYEFRTKPEFEGLSCSGYCLGYLQANLAILPSSLADEFEQFCELNRAPCPLLYRSRRGELSAGIMGQDSDVRTDLQKYCVSENGIVTKKTGDLMAYPMNDYVSFYIGCSFSFEEALTAAGIQLQNVIQNRNVSMFKTNIPCVPVGPFTSPMVVSMRPIPKDLVEKTVVITAAYDAVHGAPIHIGDPSVIGIEDINKEDFGEPSDIGDLIPVFWACGVTSSLAVRSAKLPLSFSHSPGSMFICDATVDGYFKIHKPEHGEEQPRLITLADQPFLASVCSASAIQKIEELAKIVESASGIQGADILKIAARLSHAPSVVIGFLHEKESLSSEMSTSDGLKGALALIKALQALKKKKITIVTQYHAQLIQDCLTANAAQGITKEGVSVVELDESCDFKKRLCPGEINHRLDTMIAVQLASNTCADEDGSERTIKGGLVDALFKEVNSWGKRIVSMKITADRGASSLASDVSSVDSHIMTTSSVEMATCALAAALYVLNKCPIHSRYVRHGIGRRQLFEVRQFLLNEFDEEGVCSQIVHSLEEN